MLGERPQFFNHSSASRYSSPSRSSTGKRDMWEIHSRFGLILAIPGLVGPSRGKEEEEVRVKAERGKSIPEFHRTA